MAENQYYQVVAGRQKEMGSPCTGAEPPDFEIAQVPRDQNSTSRVRFPQDPGLRAAQEGSQRSNERVLQEGTGKSVFYKSRAPH